MGWTKEQMKCGEFTAQKPARPGAKGFLPYLAHTEIHVMAPEANQQAFQKDAHNTAFIHLPQNHL